MSHKRMLKKSLHVLEKVPQFYKMITGKANPKALGASKSEAGTGEISA